MTLSLANGGSFKLTLGSVTTADIPFDPLDSDATTAGHIKENALNDALHANNSFYPDHNGPNLSVLVTPVAGGTTDFIVTFANKLANANVPKLVNFASTLQPLGTASVATSTTLEGAGNALQTLTFGGGPGGTVALTFNGVPAPGGCSSGPAFRRPRRTFRTTSIPSQSIQISPWACSITKCRQCRSPA